VAEADLAPDTELAQWWLYLLRSDQGRTYVGISRDV
jgi:predicted GIY-YIG superfamily endonuclease